MRLASKFLFIEAPYVFLNIMFNGNRTIQTIFLADLSEIQNFPQWLVNCCYIIHESTKEPNLKTIPYSINTPPKFSIHCSTFSTRILSFRRKNPKKSCISISNECNHNQNQNREARINHMTPYT